MRKQERMEKSYILKAGDWDSPDGDKTKTEGGTARLCIGMETACFCVSHPLPFSLCPYRHIYTGDRGERGKDFGRLPISSSPWRPWDQASKERTQTHTLLAATEENSLALCYTENPTFPSIRQTGRQLGVTLNPFPHVSLPNKGSALTVTSLFLLLSLFHASCLKSERRESALGNILTMIWL